MVASETTGARVQGFIKDGALSEEILELWVAAASGGGRCQLIKINQLHSPSQKIIP